MIRLQSVKKTYGKGKDQFFALNNISIEIPPVGLVAICGESGSGKTTLLNCIGGLEGAKGRIMVDNRSFERLSSAVDDFRSKNIGYIYQDYELIEELSVGQNLQLAINIAKTSCNEDGNRILAVLQMVGMEKYIKRKVSTLSGGQKQRIAIARAIINSPKILLADEPTGHLDTNNTMAVMDILKALSQQILVVWVSHERELVRTYADRIIELRDGAISSDTTNTSAHVAVKGGADFCMDLDKHTKRSIVTDKLHIDIYSVGEQKSKISLIVDGSNIYIATPEEYIVEQILEDVLKRQHENIDFVADRKEMETVTYLSPVKQTGKSRKQRKLITAFFNKQSIVPLLGFILAAIFMAISMSFNDYHGGIDYADILQYHINVLQIDNNRSFTENDIEKIKACESVREILPYHNQFYFQMRDGSFLQTSSTILDGKTISTSVLEIDYAGELVTGRRPENSSEILLDAMIAEKLLRDRNEAENITMFGYTSMNNFLNAKLCLLNSNIVLTVVGITSSSAPAIYTLHSMMQSLSLRHCLQEQYDIYTDSSLLGVLEPTESQIYISTNMVVEQGYMINQVIEFAGKKFCIVGTHALDIDNTVLINSKMADTLLMQNFYLEETPMLIMTENPNAAITALQGMGYNANSILDITMHAVNEQFNSERAARKVITVIITVAAGIVYFMTEKSKFTKRKEEITIKRVLGLSKRALLFSCILESLFEVSVLTIPAYFATVVIIGSISSCLGNVLAINAVVTSNLIIGLLIIILVAVFATWLSCVAFLKKTPAQLMKSNK